MKRSLGGGAGGAYRPVYMELLARDERYRREREGVVIGIERAIDLLEMEESPNESPKSTNRNIRHKLPVNTRLDSQNKLR